MMNTFKSKVKIGGKDYTLQHPGNREWLKVRTQLYNFKKESFDLEPFLDYAFEHVVSPEQHTFRPTLDTIPPEEVDTWIKTLSDFMKGKTLEKKR